MEQRLDVVVSAVGGAVFIRPNGVLDIKGAADFEHEILIALRRRSAKVVVDLRRVTFIDSIGLRSLFRACGWCERRDVPLSVVAGSAAVERILRVTGADMWLPLVEDMPPPLPAQDDDAPRQEAASAG
jgi:anti-anti-sigma factor